MRRNVVLAKAFTKLMGDPLCQTSRVYKDQRRTVRVDQLHDALVNLVPHFIRRHRTQFRRWNLDSEIELALVADVYDYGLGSWFVRIRTAREKTRHFFDRLLRR